MPAQWRADDGVQRIGQHGAQSLGLCDAVGVEFWVYGAQVAVFGVELCLSVANQE